MGGLCAYCQITIRFTRSRHWGIGFNNTFNHGVSVIVDVITLKEQKNGRDSWCVIRNIHLRLPPAYTILLIGVGFLRHRSTRREMERTRIPHSLGEIQEVGVWFFFSNTCDARFVSCTGSARTGTPKLYLAHFGAARQGHP